MIDFYPYMKTQEDLVAVVESEYKTKTGTELPSSFIERMLIARRHTILKGMKEGKIIKLDRLGKLVITPSRLDKNAIIDYLGDTYTVGGFKKELRRRSELGILNTQRYTKVTGARKVKLQGRLYIFSIKESNKDTEDGYVI